MNTGLTYNRPDYKYTVWELAWHSFVQYGSSASTLQDVVTKALILAGVVESSPFVVDQCT